LIDHSPISQTNSSHLLFWLIILENCWKEFATDGHIQCRIAVWGKSWILIQMPFWHGRFLPVAVGISQHNWRIGHDFAWGFKKQAANS
jgi:hypothetical protein